MREFAEMRCQGTAWSTVENAPSRGVFSFFFSSRRRHTRYWRDWSSDVCSSDLEDGDELAAGLDEPAGREARLTEQRHAIAFADGERLAAHVERVAHLVRGEQRKGEDRKSVV